MKHRHRNAKIKRQHHLIEGLQAYLETVLTPLPIVKSIIPGRIDPKRGRSGRFQVKAQYTTATGVKLLAHSAGSVQEVFVVTEDPAAVQVAVTAQPR